MDPLTGLIAGGASLLGSIFSSQTSSQNTQANIMAQQQMQTQTEGFNAEQAQMNRDFQQQMSSTAYQRSVADMKKAGLNPAMMFGSGGPASVPGGSSASVGTPNMALSNKTSPFAGLGDAVKSAISGMVSAKTIDEMGSRIADLNADRAVKEQAAVTEAAKPALLAAETGEASQRTKESAARTATEGERKGLVSQQKQTEAEATKTEAANAILRKLDIPIKGVSAVQADAILDMPDSLVRRAAQATYGTKTFGDIVGPLIGSATGAGRLGEMIKGLRAGPQSEHSTEHYDVRPGGYTRSTEKWRQ